MKDDEIHIIYFDQSVKKYGQYEIARPAYLRSDSRVVRIGDIVYNYKDTSFYNSHADISGVRIHNRLIFPLSIYHKGMRLGQVEADDGTSYMTGARNSVYLDNDTHGFRIGDELEFRLTEGKKYATVMLTDNYMSDIFVGVINQKYNPPTPDVYAYRVDAPDINGFTYYEHPTTSGYSRFAKGTTAYQTYKTNPSAPF
jgi:hypothetical protein